MMRIKQVLKANFTWDSRTALLLLITQVPAVLVAAFYSPSVGIACILGMIPAAFTGVSPKRRGRAAIVVMGLEVSAALLTGALMKVYLGMLPAAALLAVLGGLSAMYAGRSKLAQFGIAMAVPVVGVGLSYTELATPLGMAGMMLLGSALAFLVALAFPEYDAPPPAEIVAHAAEKRGVAGAAPSARRYALLYAAALATATLLGFRWDHTGWVVASTAFVMRPSEQMMKFRSAWRIASILLGALAASVLLSARPGALLATGLAALAMLCAGGLHRSRAYVLPGFMTYVVFTLILYPVQSEAAVLARLFERVGWVAVGILIACLYGILVPWLLRRRRQAQTTLR